jgi:hypothetical protein
LRVHAAVQIARVDCRTIRQQGHGPRGAAVSAQWAEPGGTPDDIAGQIAMDGAARRVLQQVIALRGERAAGTVQTVVRHVAGKDTVPDDGVAEEAATVGAGRVPADRAVDQHQELAGVIDAAAVVALRQVGGDCTVD